MVIRLKKVLRGLGRLALVLLVLCAAVLALLGLLRWRGLLLFAQEADPEQWEVFGVDVSSYQGVVDWPVLAEQGVDFAFLKATEGSALQDRQFSANWAGAFAAGIRAGAYHFLSYDSSGDAQADHFISVVPRTEGMLPPVVDIEFYGAYLTDPPERAAVRAILDPFGGVLRRQAHPLCDLSLLLSLSGGRRLWGLSHLVLQPGGLPAGAGLDLLAVFAHRPSPGLLRKPGQDRPERLPGRRGGVPALWKSGVSSSIPTRNLI